ncbi:MAG: DUF2332 domain-containing protein [Rhodospirillaceae bacterium]|nr:DUF2332 domain-containing protein [Rhodospirillaceae bacterium]
MDVALAENVAKSFRMQAKVCTGNHAPVSAAVLEGCADEIVHNGPLKDLLAQWSDHRPEAAVPLRVLGAVHRLVLDGAASELNAYFPSVGGTFDAARIWPAVRDVINRSLPFIAGYLQRAPQTNESGRSAMLLGGFLAIAAATRLPLRLLEIGASAGLNSFWDRYRVVTPNFSWGPPNSMLELNCRWDGPLPARDAPVSIASRAACDKDPVDIRDPDDRARLESYIWTDQAHRLKRIRQACDIALANDVRVERADAAVWLDEKLRDLPRGQVTVVFHSVFRQYIGPEADAVLTRVLDDAARRATTEAPLAHLAMEPVDMKSFPDITLRLWPGSGEARHLAQAHYHGEWIKWWG